jgi:hypothetical protein
VIEMIGPGIVPVRVTVLAAGVTAGGEGNVRGAGGRLPAAAPGGKLKKALSKRYDPVLVVPRAGSKTEWQVLVGREPTEESAACWRGRFGASAGKRWWCAGMSCNH